MKNQRQLMAELTEVQEQMKAISLYDRVNDNEVRLSYKKLEKKEQQLMKRLK